jgi:hypothetical protein
MTNGKCTNTEIAIHFNVQKKSSSETSTIGANWEVRYKDGNAIKVASPTAIKRLPKLVEVLDVQTITLVKVKQNPCYLVVYFAGKAVPIQVPC